MPSFLSFVYSQLFVTLPFPKQDLTGQTIIVTGANTGLGLEAARHFTRLNATKVILGVRTLRKGEEAKRSIEKSTKRTGVIEVWQLDLCSYDSVKQFAQRAQGLQRLDAIVENAGIAPSKFALIEGNESMITVNVISTFLLGVLILPKLRETATKYNVQPRLTFVSSEVHTMAKFEERKSPRLLKALNDESATDMYDRYQVSKLLEVFYARELAARFQRTGKSNVIINYLNPGLCHSSLSRDGPFFLEIMKFFLARSTEQGSRTLVSAATAGEETHGAYLSDCRVAQPGPNVLNDPEMQQRVWNEVTAELESTQPGIMANV